MSDKTTAKAIAEVDRWIDWAGDRRRPPAKHIVEDVVNAYAGALVPSGPWFPIESLPEGRNVLLYFPYGEKGVGGMECAMVFRSELDGSWSYWTHGGPNSGSDWEPRDDERPTHWMPLPEPPL